MSLVFLNGEYIPLGDARISPLDRGFTFGEGVYEVLPVFSDDIFRLDEHLNRLNDSLAAIYIENPYTSQQWKEILSDLLKKNSSDKKRSVYVQVTRGVDERTHYYSDKLKPTVFAMCKREAAGGFEEGVSAITHEDIRWKYCNIKATSLLASVLLKKIAIEKDGSNEAILVRNGRVTEGAASNVFIVKNNQVRTPPKDGFVLPGITRDLVVELLNKSDFKCKESIISVEDLLDAEEIWITSSTVGIAPVIVLDGNEVGDGKPGDVWKTVNEIYQHFVSKYSISSEDS